MGGDALFAISALLRVGVEVDLLGGLEGRLLEVRRLAEPKDIWHKSN